MSLWSGTTIQKEKNSGLGWPGFYLVYRTWSESPQLLQSFTNEPSHEAPGCKAAPKPTICTSVSLLFIQDYSSVHLAPREDKRIFHLSADVIQAVGEFNGVLLLVLIEHLQLDVQLLGLLQLLRWGRRAADKSYDSHSTCKIYCSNHD